MLKELICAVALSGTIGVTAPQNSNDGTYYQDVTITETYEYETNEVNSVDDLVVGNIYSMTFNEQPSAWANYFISNYVRVREINIELDYKSNYMVLNYSTDYGFIFYETQYTDQAQYTYSNMRINNHLIQYPLTFNFVYVSNYNINNNIDKISASDYLGEKTITVTPKEFNGLFAIFDNFLHERLFSGGILDTTNVTVFNATMSLGQWLSTTTSIVLLSLIVLLLVLLIKFIFKYVGGMMIWRS